MKRNKYYMEANRRSTPRAKGARQETREELKPSREGGKGNQIHGTEKNYRVSMLPASLPAPSL